jgi:acyl-CoA synthetase (AMP-forming)/AMP-acid ligase II
MAALSHYGYAYGIAILFECSLKKNDVIGILAPNCPEYGTTVHGSTALGVIVSPFNPAYTETEIKHQLKDSGAKLMVCGPVKK